MMVFLLGFIPGILLQHAFHAVGPRGKSSLDWWAVSGGAATLPLAITLTFVRGRRTHARATRKSTKVRTVAPTWHVRVKIRPRRLLKAVGTALCVLLFPALIAWLVLALVYGWRAGPWILLGVVI
jgi:hypothetical protein